MSQRQLFECTLQPSIPCCVFLKQRGNFIVPKLTGKHQSISFFMVLKVNIGLILNKLSGHFDLPSLRCVHQSGQTSTVVKLTVNFCSMLKKITNNPLDSISSNCV